jgi:hypothetical protein
MAGLSDRICGIAGVLGVLIVNHDGAIIEESYLSESARAILKDLTPSLFQTVRHCERHDPDVRHLRLRFCDLTVFVKIHKRGFIIAICNNDLIIYLLESSIESLIAETERPEPE